MSYVIDGETLAKNDVTTEHNVVYITDGSVYWNGSATAFNPNGAKAHAYAIYEVQEAYAATISDLQWATFAAPVATTIPEGVTAYIATGTTNGKLDLQPITGVLPANTGVLLYAETADTYIFKPTEEESVAVTNNIFVGTTEEISVEDKSVYVLADGNNGLGFYLLSGTQMQANKAYIQVSSVNKAATFLGFGAGDSDITGIESAEAAADAAVQSAIHYDLQGRRVAAPQKGQLYIVNGKKVLY